MKSTLLSRAVLALVFPAVLVVSQAEAAMRTKTCAHASIDEVSDNDRLYAGTWISLDSGAFGSLQKVDVAVNYVTVPYGDHTRRIVVRGLDGYSFERDIRLDRAEHGDVRVKLTGRATTDQGMVCRIDPVIRTFEW